MGATKGHNLKGVTGFVSKRYMWATHPPGQCRGPPTHLGNMGRDVLRTPKDEGLEGGDAVLPQLVVFHGHEHHQLRHHGHQLLAEPVAGLPTTDGGGGLLLDSITQLEPSSNLSCRVNQ